LPPSPFEQRQTLRKCALERTRRAFGGHRKGDARRLHARDSAQVQAASAFEREVALLDDGLQRLAQRARQAAGLAAADEHDQQRVGTRRGHAGRRRRLMSEVHNQPKF
jgi:hypothetical protein